MNPSNAASGSYSYLKSLKRLLTSDSNPKLGLERIDLLLEVLGNPQQNFSSIHVAGTNGKGSTCAFLSSLSSKRVNKVGLFTSPHLLSCRERIQINGQPISEELFCESEAVVFEAMKKNGEIASFFEQITAMAFWIFAKERVDIAIIEVGLGGRLDATNVLTPLASVITRIDMDHTHILGDTLGAIAREKAGIIKPRIPVITGFQKAEAYEVIQDVADKNNSTLINVTDPYPGLLSLFGLHQKQNAALAVAALKSAGIELTQNETETALSQTFWPCRFETVQEDPTIILDGAHNESGMQILVQTLRQHFELSTARIIVVLGTTQGHNDQEMIKALAALKDQIELVISTESKSRRATNHTDLANHLRNYFCVEESSSVPDAIDLARSKVPPNGLIIVTGSLYVVGEARALFHKMPIDPELPIF